MATYTSVQTGDLNDTNTWDVAGTPGDGDIAIVDSGHTVTVTANVTVGDGTNAGIELNGASAVSYGTLIVNDNITLTVKGGDTSSNPAILVNRYAKFEPAAGATIAIYCASDYSTCIVNNGYITSTGTNGNEITFTTDSNGRSWDNDATDETVAGSNKYLFDGGNDVWVGKLANRAVSNAGGTGIGSYGDSSFTPDLVNTTPVGIMTTEVSSYANISSAGDYYVDYDLGVFYFKNTAAYPSIELDYKYLSYYGSGIISHGNTDNSSATFDYTNFEYMGSDSTASEYLYGALMFRYKFSPAVDSDRQMWVKNCTFTYCFRPVTLNACDGSSGNEIEVEYNTFTGCWQPNSGSVWLNGAIFLSSCDYVSVNNNTINVYGNGLAGTGARPCNYIYCDDNTGSMLNIGGIITGVNIYYRRNNITGFSSLNDARAIATEGSSSGFNYWQDNTYVAGGRIASVGSYMIIERNTFSRFYHHGFTTHTSDGYLQKSQIQNNIIYDCTHTNATMGGGLTTGYNRSNWIDLFVWANNTCDGGERGLNLNDEENGGAVLVTRSYIINNIISNSKDGIYLAPEDATDESKLAPYQLDYNIEYNNSGGNATNIVQATFKFSGGNEYNTDDTRNLRGFVLFDPDSSYSLPYTTNTTLALTVSGTAGTDLAYEVVWDGGAAVDLVVGQGTASGGTTSTLIDSGAGWTINEFRCCQVKIHSGTGAGQIGLVKSNTADTLTIIANNDNDVWATAPAADSVFVIYDSMIQPAASDAKTVRVGIYLPDGSFPTASTSDTNIHIYSYKQTGDPAYVDRSGGDLHITSGSSARGNATDDPSSEFASMGLQAVTDDIDQDTRVAWDIGADEYTGIVAIVMHHKDQAAA